MLVLVHIGRGQVSRYVLYAPEALIASKYIDITTP
jgi:hypothetical protein